MVSLQPAFEASYNTLPVDQQNPAKTNQHEAPMHYTWTLGREKTDPFLRIGDPDQTRTALPGVTVSVAQSHAGGGAQLDMSQNRNRSIS